MAALDDAQRTALERSLYDTRRADRGRVHLLRRMARQAATQRLKERHETLAAECEKDARHIERILPGDRKRL